MHLFWWYLVGWLVGFGFRGFFMAHSWTNYKIPETGQSLLVWEVIRYLSLQSHICMPVCIYSLLAFKHRNLVGVCLEMFALGNLTQNKELTVKESFKFENSY